WTPALVARALRSGARPSDAVFDRIYPPWVRELSAMHWTPLEVAREAAPLLAVRPHLRILDAGSGAGKMCIVGGLTTTARWTGIERRAALCAAARRAALATGADVELRRGDFLAVD